MYSQSIVFTPTNISQPIDSIIFRWHIKAMVMVFLLLFVLSIKWFLASKTHVFLVHLQEIKLSNEYYFGQK